jgi:hypothetical protein
MCFLASSSVSVIFAPHLLWIETLVVFFSIISEKTSLNKTERIPSMRVVFPVPENPSQSTKKLKFSFYKQKKKIECVF